MQHDTVIWSVISPGNGGFCSYRRKLPGSPAKFCKNPYNVLGLCDPKACPLANSRYATIRERKGEIYLLIKTIERAHSPAKHWEKIKLSKDYMTALKEIDQHLCWWPKWYIHKCKLRLTKIHQYLIRARKLALSFQPKLVRIWKPYERQQKIREKKAEIAAKITNVVKEELLIRLNEGVYEGIYNFPMKTYNEILKEKGEADTEYETEDEKQMVSKKKHEFVGVIDSDDDLEFESDEDIEDFNQEKEMEYEYEMEYPNMSSDKKMVETNNFGQTVRSMKGGQKKNIAKKKSKDDVKDFVERKSKKWNQKIHKMEKSVLGKRVNRNQGPKRKRIKIGYD